MGGKEAERGRERDTVCICVCLCACVCISSVETNLAASLAIGSSHGREVGQGFDLGTGFDIIF